MMNSDAPRIGVLGDAMIDYLVKLPEETWPDEKTTAVSSSRELGGTGANAAATIRLLGGSVELGATVSDDAYGQWIVGELRARGIGTEEILFREGPVPQATILTTSHERRVIVDRGVSDDVAVPSRAWLKSQSLVYVSNASAILPLIDDFGGVPLVLGIEHQMFESIAGLDPLFSASVIVIRGP